MQPVVTSRDTYIHATIFLLSSCISVSIPLQRNPRQSISPAPRQQSIPLFQPRNTLGHSGTAPPSPSLPNHLFSRSQQSVHRRSYRLYSTGSTKHHHCCLTTLLLHRTAGSDCLPSTLTSSLPFFFSDTVHIVEWTVTKFQSLKVGRFSCIPEPRQFLTYIEDACLSTKESRKKKTADSGNQNVAMSSSHPSRASTPTYI
jgi:hypothetical protein